jgi:hypothetical protein
LPAGAIAVVLDDAVVPLTTAIEDLGRPWHYRVGPADRDQADPSYVALDATAVAVALQPRSPVAVSARRNVGGIAITFIRRTRQGGDGWEGLEVPLGEATEQYEVDILVAGAVARTLASPTPSLTYAAADELTDFGTAQATLSLNVVQISATVGRGVAATVTVPVL